jgi:uncharacterized repeat protein (TIGR01451 family)
LTSHRVLRHRVHLLGGVVLVVLALLLAAPAAQAQGPEDLPDVDLSIDKTDDPDPVGEGEELTYSLTGENQGPLVATGVEIVDTLPPQVDFQDASAGCSYRGATHTVICRPSLLELLLPSQTKTFNIDVIPTEAGTLINVAEISGDQDDPDEDDNTDTEFTTVQDGDGDGDGPGTKSCDGEPATIVGTFGDDDIDGTSGADVIAALAGDDTIDGNGGNDRICGDAGFDDVDGDSGFDRIFGGTGSDTSLFGGDSAESDVIEGQGGHDSASGGPGNDLVLGGSDNDTLRGNTGRDGIIGESGDDDMFGDEENDALFGAEGDDFADGGSGTRDFCRAESRVRCER